MIAWLAGHQTAANLLMGAIMIPGLVAVLGLQRETLPEIQNDKVEVRIPYKGATPDEVEDVVCRRLEDTGGARETGREKETGNRKISSRQGAAHQLMR